MGEKEDAGRFLHDIDGVEGFFHIGAYGEDAVLAPKDDIVVVELGEGLFGKSDAAGLEIGDDADAAWNEESRFGHHGEELIGEGVERGEAMGEGDEMMGMGVECGLMRGMGGDEIVVDGEMGGELAGGEDRTAGYDNIMLSVGEDADYRPIVHRRTS